MSEQLATSEQHATAERHATAEQLATRGITVLRGGVEQIAAAAGAAERLGFHSVWSPEFYTRSAVVTLARMA
ncbi:MAG TPA: hypothetical protein VGH72_16765, partial [Pseudonocardia sp.]